jgi:uncharacterized protein YjeT (DUF2065 family)
MTSFPLGSRVILQNLTNADFNGKIGSVKSKLENGRYKVLLIKDGKTLGIKPDNLKYEPRSVNSLNIKEMKQVLTIKEVGNLTGYDKSQLREMVKIKTESEEEIAEILAMANEPTESSDNTGLPMKQRMQSQASQLANMTPAQLRQQAQMMRSMPPDQIRRMNPAMAGFSDAQILMAANQMETMANNPQMMKTMVDQMSNMSDEELEQVRRMQSGQAPSDFSPRATGNEVPSMENMTPEQLQMQADAMKAMDKNTIRSMNPQMAQWSDTQIDMAISQMEMMAKNPQMMQNLKEQMKNMKPEDMEKIKKMAAGDAFGGANGGMPENPMDFLNNSDPAQIKNMLNMVKENPSLMKDMLRSSNPAMADQLTDEQIEKTINAFAGMDESKIGMLLKVFNWVQEFRKSGKAKVAAFCVLSFFLFVIGMLFYLIRSAKTMGSSATVNGDEGAIPDVPIMDSEF